MTGTVSAGAYTAGVIDFLVEAMDAWYAERERQKTRFGTNYAAWTIPPHELELAVLAGASGGGITAALTAAALNQNFGHIREQRAEKNASLNNLFQSWVVDIDISKLLGHADLDQGGKIVSLLDSTPIHQIAAKAFRVQSLLSARRPWVRDGLKVVLTVTNLRGIPYAIEPDSSDEAARLLYYADRQDFAVTWDVAATGTDVLPLLPDGSGAWPQLAKTAVATSAFPVVLAAQTLKRTAGEYNARRWRISHDNPKCGGDGMCLCETNEGMPPSWELKERNDIEFNTLKGRQPLGDCPNSRDQECRAACGSGDVGIRGVCVPKISRA